MADTFSPPMEPTAEIEPPRTRWPVVIGVFSLIYVFFGATCLSLAYGWMLSVEHLPELWGGGTIVPPVMKAISIYGLIATWGLGLLLIVASIRLMKRRRTAVKQLKAWAVLRLCILVLDLILGFVTVQAQMEMEKSSILHNIKIKEEMEREGNPGADWIPTDLPEPAEHRRSIVTKTVIFTAIAAVYPLFLALFLSRQKITDQVERWD